MGQEENSQFEGSVPLKPSFNCKVMLSYCDRQTDVVSYVTDRLAKEGQCR